MCVIATLITLCLTFSRPPPAHSLRAPTSILSLQGTLGPRHRPIHNPFNRHLSRFTDPYTLPIGPSVHLTPAEVVYTACASLRHNDVPYTDAGVDRVRAFSAQDSTIPRNATDPMLYMHNFVLTHYERKSESAATVHATIYPVLTPWMPVLFVWQLRRRYYRWYIVSVNTMAPEKRSIV